MNARIYLLLAAVGALSAAAGCDLASSAREAARGGDATSPGAPRASATSDGGSETAPAAANDAPPPASASGVVEASFDDLKFDMEKTETFERSMLTPKVQSLFGKRIRLRGYMFPTLHRRGLTQFVLVRDNLECCFGPGAALFDCVVVSMAPGKTAEYSIGQIAVEGEFRFEEVTGPDGRPLAIYQMVGQGVE